jgi:uncharacterized membrane protein YqjE
MKKSDVTGRLDIIDVKLEFQDNALQKQNETTRKQNEAFEKVLIILEKLTSIEEKLSDFKTRIESLEMSDKKDLVLRSIVNFVIKLILALISVGSITVGILSFLHWIGKF